MKHIRHVRTPLHALDTNSPISAPVVSASEGTFPRYGGLDGPITIPALSPVGHTFPLGQPVIAKIYYILPGCFVLAKDE